MHSFSIKTVQWLAALAVMLLVPAAHAQSRTQEILECIQANLPDTASSRRVKLEHVDRMGETSQVEVQIFASFANNEFDATVKILSPASLEGGAYLLQDSAQGHNLYMYLPSIDKVKRVVGEGATETKMLGTDLSWDDLRLMHKAFMEGTLSLRGEDEVLGRSVYQLILIPSPTSDTPYDRFYVDVDQQTCVPIKVQLMESNDRVRKVFTVEPDSLQQAGGKYWYAARSELRDMKDKTHTRMMVSGLKADRKLSGFLFDPKRFYSKR